MADAPNVVFFFSDQQRWDTCGCYGQRVDVTPNLDRMAAEGTRFEHAFTCQPVCGPARACIQTGKYAAEVGCFHNDIALPQTEKTIAHWFSDAGYELGYIGKWHLASTGRGTIPEENFATRAMPPERRGGWKDFWLAADVLEFTSHSYDGHMFNAGMERVDFPENRYRVDCLTDFALDFIRTRDGSRPFFLFVSYIEPHHQNDHKHYEGPKGSKERFRNFVVPGDLEGTAGDWREEYPDYLGCCASLDENTGRILAELDRLGLSDDTLVIYASDHGSHFRTRNAEYKRSCHDGCLRVPLLMRGPGFRGGLDVNELVSLIDLPPTLLATAGVDKPSYMRGGALQRLVSNKTAGWPQEIFAQISESHVGRCIRTKQWKYSVRAPGGDGWKDASSSVYAEDFLYDLAADPHERNNLAADPACEDVRKELRRTLVRRMRDAGEQEPRIDPARTD